MAVARPIISNAEGLLYQRTSMAVDYSVEVCRELEGKFAAAGLHRPMRTAHYEPGDELGFEVTSVEHAAKAVVKLRVERFVGGGFAGQVYQVRILDIQAQDGPVEGLEIDGLYAMKILIPPSRFSRLFRNFLYWVGFQGPFQLQVNPSAARAGAIWQKFIRRAAKARFDDERAVVDIHATFVDEKLGSCGELSEWIDGRTWQLEVDDRMDLLRKSQPGKTSEAELGSPEYRAKYRFMREFVELLHDMGAHEFARQYEWSTCKSQPNCLKRKDAGDGPAAGLTAVDFRAGLALLPFLPMSPGDFKLILKGLMRGSLVQFDRGNIRKLEVFMGEHRAAFAETGRMFDELKQAEEIYRNSTPDITHNHIRLLCSPRLWATMLDSAVTGWRVRNITDAAHEPKLRRSRPATLLFLVIGLVPLLGKVLRRLWARSDWRKHYGSILTSFDYFKRAVKARIIEKTIAWHQKGRISAERAQKFAEQPWRYFCHLPFLLLLLPSLHRLVTDGKFAKEKLRYIFIRPVRLYFNAEFREQWLRDMVKEGQSKHMLSDEDAKVIISQLNEPFIQKYLKCLAVHVCTLPVTQVVSVMVAIWYKVANDLTWGQAWDEMLLILWVFQLVPISPGSLVRGFYVLYLVIKERNFKDYNIAVFLGFFKYIGYLAFPIQMTHRYPALSRFMAGHWATDATHIVPVFGERGALLEHWVFCLFYNWPLTIRRRMRKRAELRAQIKPRYWHAGIYAAAIAACLVLVDLSYIRDAGVLPSKGQIWWLLAALPLLNGAVVTLGCGGATVWKRIVAALAGGIAAVTACTIAAAVLRADTTGITAKILAKTWVWRSFIFAIVSAIGAIITELRLGEPRTD
ncbi:MAG: hypothetical protein JW720_00310 [Sedimentisphaerales bacterium]|nr:hypothetical protein [Sedimentisphaerales bacterium]